MDGSRHGKQVTRWSDGSVVETPWVEGTIHGTQVVTRGTGTVIETPWVQGIIHGTQVVRHPPLEAWSDQRQEEHVYVAGVPRYDKRYFRITTIVWGPNGEVQGVSWGIHPDKL